MMTPKERVVAAVRFSGPDRTPYLRWDRLDESDFVADWARPAETPTPRPRTWIDEWGCRWDTVDSTSGQVFGHPIQSVADYARFQFPEPTLRLDALRANRREYDDRVCVAAIGHFFFERLEKLREFSEFMMDLAAERDAIEAFLDRMEAYFLRVVDACADSGLVDCIGVNEDLGLQDRLTISPAMWREIFMPRYRAVYQRARQRGLIVFQHSCGYIQDIVADLAEAGVDILEMQQLACMDMDAVAAARGRMCISAPVDIQAVLPTGDWERIAAFQERLFRTFDQQAGGYIPQIYSDLAALDIPSELVDRMDEFIQSRRDWRRRIR